MGCSQPNRVLICYTCPMGEYLSLPEAARIAGYRNASTLHVAAHRGHLRTETVGHTARVITRRWLDAYLEGVRTRGTARRQPRTAVRRQVTGTETME